MKKIFVTSRLFRIALLVTMGKSNQEIATAMNIKIRTQNGHMVKLLNKIGCKNRVGLMRAFLNNEISTRIG